MVQRLQSCHLRARIHPLRNWSCRSVGIRSHIFLVIACKLPSEVGFVGLTLALTTHPIQADKCHAQDMNVTCEDSHLVNVVVNDSLLMDASMKCGMSFVIR